MIEEDCMKEGEMRGCGGGREGFGETELGFWKKLGKIRKRYCREWSGVSTCASSLFDLSSART